MPVALVVVVTKPVLSLILPHRLEYIQRHSERSLRLLLMLCFSCIIRSLLLVHIVITASETASEITGSVHPMSKFTANIAVKVEAGSAEEEVQVYEGF